MGAGYDKLKQTGTAWDLYDLKKNETVVCKEMAYTPERLEDDTYKDKLKKQILAVKIPIIFLRNNDPFSSFLSHIKRELKGKKIRNAKEANAFQKVLIKFLEHSLFDYQNNLELMKFASEHNKEFICIDKDQLQQDPKKSINEGLNKWNFQPINGESIIFSLIINPGDQKTGYQMPDDDWETSVGLHWDKKIITQTVEEKIHEVGQYFSKNLRSRMISYLEKLQSQTEQHKKIMEEKFLISKRDEL